MFTRKEITIDRYSNGKFIVEIEETATGFEAWICGEGYGTKEYMFGMSKLPLFGSTGHRIAKGEFEERVFANFDEYAEEYAENHF